MNVSRVLLDILVVLLVAKAAAEVAERAKVPAVVGEILAGVLIGPSALGLISGGEDVLRVLGELGVILLLLDVGMEMDLGELAAVGRASVSVAVVGVAVPFGAGWATASALGMSGNEAMFVGAALTATSVGITARVFGDLRALATVEARTVLGAAVADDVIGLVILTVVVRLASEGHVSPVAVGGIILVAVGFLVVTSYGGIRFAPRLFSSLAQFSRSSGTLVAVALAFTLGLAELANAARLAPIVGAFVAGLALSRCAVAPRIRRELTPVGHLFIPVFFLQIGIDADVGQFANAKVLAVAGVLLVVAVAGKLCSSAGMWRSPGDRLLVGIGMIPRGEVGLIFATLGLREHIFGEDVYASLLLVVLITTLVTPPLLRWRLLQLRSDRRPTTTPEPRPAGGWLTVAPGPGGGTVELAAEPPPSEALSVALDVALAGEQHQPGPNVITWLASGGDVPLRWDGAARTRLFKVLDAGGPRAWRFLALTGVLARALPELGQALDRRQADPFELDPTRALRWPTLALLQGFEGRRLVQHPEWLLLAAVILDATEGDTTPPVVVARKVMQRLDLGAAAEQAVAGLVGDIGLLPAAARRIDAFDEEPVLQLAVHLRSSERAQALALLAEAHHELSPVERDRLHQLHAALQSALAQPALTGREAANAVEQRRAAALRLTSDPAVSDRIRAAPRAYVLASTPQDLVRHAAMCEPPPGRDEVRVRSEPVAGEIHRLDVVALDRVGLMAAEAHTFAAAGMNVLSAVVATWGDGLALGSFRVSSSVPPAPDEFEATLRQNLRRTPVPIPLPDAVVEFDDQASPWHTICRVTAPDRPGTLHAITAAFAAAGASVHSARVASVGTRAADEFELTDRDGHKLSPTAEDDFRRLLSQAVGPERRRFGRWRGPLRRPRQAPENGQVSGANLKQSSDRSEISSP